MKRYIPWIVLAVAALWLASNSRMPKTAPGDFDLSTFGKLPVLSEGRNKPFDTVARNALLILRGKQTLRLEDGRTITATHWLADVLFHAPGADGYPAFVINNPDVLGLFGWEQKDRKYFTYDELAPFLSKIDAQGQSVESVEVPNRTPYQTAISNLRNSLMLYQRLKNSLRPEGSKDFASAIDAGVKTMAAGLEAAAKRAKKETFDQGSFDAFARFAAICETMAELGYVLPVPPDPAGGGKREEWLSIGASLLQTISTGAVNPVTKAYAATGDAYHNGNAALFNQHLSDLSGWMAKNEPRATGHAAYEFLFNQLEPFYQAMGLYVLAFLLVCGFWLGGNRSLNTAAFYVILLALAVHTFGLGSRMYLQGRPPVTNLYSSAIFIGWGTVIIGLILERIFRDGIGAACAAAIGFITLIIAHHLAGSGDTLGMLQAVLDTNIWLATHVVTITIGYAAMFLAGTLAIIYVVRGVFTRSLTKESAQSLTRMTYGVICFATLFSFVGTVLGGIWADQSWGRFWGWDPKENGALLIVLWCAIILHARLGGFIRQRGLMVMALFGSVITSFSWFGVNMLGVGLHSYGFMNKAVPWLAGFMISQLALMAIASLPLARWRSFHQPAPGSIRPS
jgi:ABC-type transport system involved in cytochrome c biogenesis permease subunit